MRGARLALLILLATNAACRSGASEPEAGAVLLQVKRPAGAPAPDELRIWVYDDGGRLWDGVRVPPEGPLPSDQPELGTVLIQPGAVQGKLRIHLRGLAAGARVLDGVVIVDVGAADRAVDLLLDPAPPADADGDGVPDSFDDCVGVANPGQGGCALVPIPDAGTDAPPSPPDLPLGADGPRVVDGPGDSAVRDLGLGEDSSPPAFDTPPVMPDLVPPPSDGVSQTAPEAGRDTAESAQRDQGRDTADAVGDTRDAPAEVSAADVGPDAPGADSSACADGGCGDKSQGEACAGNRECASGSCADGVCCTNPCVGPCRSCNQPSTTGICQSYGAGSDPEVECSAGTSCNGAGACGPTTNPDLPNGELCTAGSQCRSGQCVDGVCCATKCDQPCESCGTGTCLAVKKADDVPECSGVKTCNPTGKCIDN